MKKLFSVLVALILVPLLFASIIHASPGTGVLQSSPEEDNNGADIYHVLVGGTYAFVHMSLPRYNSQDQYVTSYETQGDHTLTFQDPSNIWFDRYVWNPNTNLYSIFIIEMKQENGQYSTVFYSRDDEYDQIHIQSQTEGLNLSWVDYSTISMGEDTQFYQLIPGEYYKMYWATSMVYNNLTIAELPSTSGSPYTSGAYGRVTLSLTELSGLNVSIFYNNDYYNLSTLYIDDITVFENVQKAYYWTDGNNKFISMTYEDKDPVFLKNLGVTAAQWTDTVTWNLTTNEIRSVNKVIVYAHHGQDSNNYVYSYLYIPNLIFDDIISITAGFVYHYEYWNGLQTGDSMYINKTLTLGEEEDITLAWEKKLLLNYSAAITSFWNPIYTIGSLLYANTSWSKSTFEEIEKIQYPSVSLVEELQSKWFAEYGENVVIDTLDHSLYKLNWGQFDKFGSTKLVIEEYPDGDPRNFSFSEIVVVKDGSVLVLTDFDIILKDTLDNSVKPTPKPPTIEDLLLEYWWIGGIIAFLLLYDKLIGVVESTSKLFSVISTKNGKIAFIVIVAIIGYFLVKYGILTI
jgi:hypothetical protein